MTPSALPPGPAPGPAPRSTWIPPSGPLVWLFPELASLARAPNPADVFGDEWIELARRRKESGPVVIEAGPRGDRLVQFLRQRTREPIERELDDRSLEAVMTRAANGSTSLPSHPLWPIDPTDAERNLERALTAAASLPPSAPRPIPYFRTDHPADERRAIHTRLFPTWFGLLPGDHYPDAVRSRWHELLKRLWPDRFWRFLAFENAALAGFDLYDDVLRGRARRPAIGTRQSDSSVPLIAIDGIDGSGKSSHVAALRDHLAAKGRRVAVHKLFRHGLFHATVTDLVAQCAGGERLHLWPLQRVIKAFDSLKHWSATVAPALASGSCDIALFDRWTPTHLAEAIGRTHHDPWSRELLEALPRPDLIALLDLPAELALERIGDRGTKTVDENRYMLGRWREALLSLARREGWLVLDARAPFAENQAKLRVAADAALERRRCSS